MASARKRGTDAGPAEAAVTMPAPPARGGQARPTVVQAASGEDLPSSRPTSVPDYDVGALAAASFHQAGPPKLPLDLAVPVRRGASPDGAPLRAAFLFSHVDDRMSIAELAACAQIPLDDALEAFAVLADLGVVELRGVPGPLTAAPEDELRAPGSALESGLRTKT